MDLKVRINEVFTDLGRPGDIFTILDKLNQKYEEKTDKKKLIDILENDYEFFEAENGIFYKTNTVLNGLVFFTLPDGEDLKFGRLSVVGGELMFMLQPALRKGEVTFKTDHGEFKSYFKVDDNDFFYFNNLDDWYKKENIKLGKHVIYITIDDYMGPVYKLSKIPEKQFNDFMDSSIPDEICDEIIDVVTNMPNRLVGEVEEKISSANILKLMLHDKKFDFTSYPANISFYMSLDHRFSMLGNSFAVDEEAQYDDEFAKYYIGDENGIYMDEEDIEKLDIALADLFENDKIKQGQKVIKELKLKYPEEKMLNKFLYQAAYFLEDGETIIRYADEYRKAFPNDPDPYRTKAEVFLQYGDFDMADKNLEKAFKLVHPEDKLFKSELYTVGMYIKWENREDENAFAMAIQAIEENENNEEAGMFLMEHGKMPKKNKPVAKLKNIGKKSSNIIPVDFKRGDGV